MFTVRKFSHEESAFVVWATIEHGFVSGDKLVADDLEFFCRFGLLLRELAQQWLAGF